MSSFGVTHTNNNQIAVCNGEAISLWTVEGSLVAKLQNSKLYNFCHITSLEVRQQYSNLIKLFMSILNFSKLVLSFNIPSTQI